MLHVFKRSHNAHIMFNFGHFTVYAYSAYQTSDFFCKKNPLNFHFNTRNHFRDEITRLVMNTRLFTTLKNVDMFKIIEFYRFIHPHFAVESASKFSLCILWKMVLLVVHNFQNGDQYRMLQNVSINFLLFYHNNIMLKTDIMLDYW